MQPPSMSLLRAFSPLCASLPIPPPVHCLNKSFSTNPSLLARKGKNKGPKPDQRIALLRYALQHPLTPRPLRFSRNRSLRHWTIHRAFQLHQANVRLAQTLSLEKQYRSMASACEALRLMDSDGLTEQEREQLGVKSAGAGPEKGEGGKLYRVAMEKKGIWEGVPIEYARAQVDTPPRAGWNHAWTR
ncbi:hypothetical protein B0A48_06697 [Cryoendolithus antarcticus]|uniref:Uncharacterized protein n=1 Tax=Cryoendolithus antarcticus TaxID=1507870 RepID=A0A1V8T936_9PEZI|nr:hypothetical protein B0A48_06697 [Cryoendolithus antarcticus]